VNQFWENAQRILATAEEALRAGSTATEWTILVDDNGGLQMIADTDQPLDSYRWDRGTTMAYRVRRAANALVLEGCGPGQSCRIQTQPRPAIVRRLLDSSPPWQGTQPVQPVKAALPPASIWQPPPEEWD